MSLSTWMYHHLHRLLVSIALGLRHFLAYHFISLYTFQEYIDTYSIHYSPTAFPRIHQNIAANYALTQYREIYGEPNSPANYPLTVSLSSFHLRFPKYTFALFLLRCLAILCFKWPTDSRERRILFGTEMFQPDAVYYEITFALWSVIGYGFYGCALTRSLLDYSFLAILRMTQTAGSRYLNYRAFGLTQSCYQKFAKFRFAARVAYGYILATILACTPVAFIGLLLKAELHRTNAAHSALWFAFFNTWAYSVCAVLYSNYISLIVIIKYLLIKQQSLIASLSLRLRQLSTCTRQAHSLDHPRIPRRQKVKLNLLTRRIMATYSSYVSLYDEAFSYNHFWSVALSFFTLAYILLIALIIYLLLITGAAFYVKFAYTCFLVFHLALLSTIIKYAGDLLLNNGRLYRQFHRTMAQVEAPQGTLPVHLKFHTMGQSLAGMKAPFFLLNNYPITHETYRDIAGNIATYFLLIVKRWS